MPRALPTIGGPRTRAHQPLVGPAEQHLLKNGANVNAADSKGQTAMHKVSNASACFPFAPTAFCCPLTLLDVTVQAGSKGGQDVIEVLLGSRGDASVRDSKVPRAHSAAHRWPRARPEVANRRARCRQGRTALHLACARGDVGCIDNLLLAEGA